MADALTLPSPDDPEAALASVVALRDLADRLEAEAVVQAIAQGWPWSRVAECLGISKQGAHKKFIHLLAERGGRS